MVPIPTPNDLTPDASGAVNRTVKQDLDGVTYALRFEWNPRINVWRMHIYSEDELTPILLGLELVTGLPIAHSKLPGFIEVIQLAALANVPNDLNALGVFYNTRADLIATGFVTS